MTKSKKKIIAISAAGVILLAGAFSVWWFFLRGSGTRGSVSVEKVSVIAELGYGLQNRFAGVVEPQAKQEISLDGSRQLKECYVEVGQEVAVGEILFVYDTEPLELALEQMIIDKERIENSISVSAAQVELLKKERDLVSQAQKLEYTTQILSLEAQIKQQEFNLKSKDLEINDTRNRIDNSAVFNDFPGVVQAINDPRGAQFDSNGNPLPFMVILAKGEYRVKGQINEQNIWDLQAGTQVVVRSRLDENVTWEGTVDYVDTKNPIESGYGGYYSGYGSSPGSTKYPFYVSLVDSSALMLGQHVFIEPFVEDKSGEQIWLLENYIVMDDGEQPYVWAVNRAGDRIEKRPVTLGEYDGAQGKYLIFSGLEPDDEIAWPSEGIVPGQAVVRGSFTPGGGEGETVTLPEGNIDILPESGEDQIIIIDEETPAPTNGPQSEDVPPASGSSLRPVEHNFDITVEIPSYDGEG